MKVLLSDSFTKISVTTGSIQNVSDNIIEISSNQTIGNGILLKPYDVFGFFDTTLYARCYNGGGGYIRVVTFIDSSSSGSGGSSSSSQTVPEDQVATDEEIDSLIEDVFGGGSSSSSQTVPEDQVATDEDIQALIDEVFG